ncbi:MAG: tetratricopeptide repeat protein, partial [Planctomycetes bacterium]|nr:tetratricopeptide repeat protein [Planctomycetota bacterium]
ETSDVYSLGVTLYNMLAGDISEELRMRLFDPEQLSSARPKLAGVLSGDDTRFFSEVIEGMCEREPADRPLMIEVLSQLEEYLAQNQIAETRFHERPKAKPSTAKRTTEYLGNSNIREPLAPFVGRQHELRQLAETLGVSESGTLKQDHEPPRVLTLLGSGGAGKTRLAQRFAALYQSAFPGGTWFADLSQCQNAEDIVHTVAGIFRIRLQNPESAASVVGNALAGRARTAQGRLLMVLDNFEQCVDAAESVLGEWLSKSDQITVLVTSRMLLGLSGEEEFNVGSLSLPPRDEELPFADEGTKTQARQLENFDAVRLFMSRARASTPELSLDPSQVPAIVEICRRLDGNPLALELAASRVKVLPPAKLLERLDNRFEILRSGRRSNESRQSTLRSTIDWSWDLLADYERSALAQLSTFRSGFMLEAAEAVLDLSEFDDAPSIVDVVQSLRDKSLINRRDAESTDAGIRFGFFESIRDYAFERKAEQLDDDQLNALHLRFGRYFVGYAQRLGEEIFGPSGPTALNALELEIANVLEAQELLLEMESPYLAAQAICAIADVLNVRGPHAKRIPYLERSLSAIDVKEPDIGKIGVPSTDELYQAFAPLPEWIDTELDPLRVCAQVIELLVNLTAAYLDGGNTLSAERAAQRAVNLARGLGSVLSGPEESAEWERSSRLLARALDTFSAVEERRANNEQALEAIHEAEEIERELSSPVALANIISQRGNIMIRMERADEALRAYQEAEQICRQCGNQIGLTINVSNRGWVALLLGRYDEALRCFSEGEELSRILHFRNGLGWNIGCRGNVHQNRGEFDQALECLEEAELIFREMGNLVSVANNVGNRGGVLAELGRYDEALACYAEAEGIARRAGDEENLSF